ncbi:type II secretion system protein [bacterium]|nr:type II secretion system protein [bacterium]
MPMGGGVKLSKGKYWGRLLAFTLAEVLITLGIIGIVAALTIPTLMQKSQERETVSKLKKVYSTLSNAYNLAVNDEGNPDEWDLDTNNNRILTYLMPHLNVLKDCTKNSISDCNINLKYKYLNGVNATSYNSYPGIFLSDGTLILSQKLSEPNCSGKRGESLPLSNICGEYYIDINGIQKPNILGKDMFYFYLSEYGIIPFGTKGDSDSFSKNCSISSSWSWGCTAWVLQNENMDYLHCTDLSWGGKTKCD